MCEQLTYIVILFNPARRYCCHGFPLKGSAESEQRPEHDLRPCKAVSHWHIRSLQQSLSFGKNDGYRHRRTRLDHHDKDFDGRRNGRRSAGVAHTHHIHVLRSKVHDQMTGDRSPCRSASQRSGNSSSHTMGRRDGGGDPIFRHALSESFGPCVRFHCSGDCAVD